MHVFNFISWVEAWLFRFLLLCPTTLWCSGTCILLCIRITQETDLKLPRFLALTHIPHQRFWIHGFEVGPRSMYFWQEHQAILMQRSIVHNLRNTVLGTCNEGSKTNAFFRVYKMNANHVAGIVAEPSTCTQVFLLRERDSFMHGAFQLLLYIRIIWGNVLNMQKFYFKNVEILIQLVRCVGPCTFWKALQVILRYSLNWKPYICLGHW